MKVYQREEAYRIYVSDALRGALKLDIRLYDILYPHTDNRTAEEIIRGIKKKLSRG